MSYRFNKCYRTLFYYKENDTIYYYDQCDGLITTDVYKILGSKANPFIGFFLYYNQGKKKCMLLKDKD